MERWSEGVVRWDPARRKYYWIDAADVDQDELRTAPVFLDLSSQPGWPRPGEVE